MSTDNIVMSICGLGLAAFVVVLVSLCLGRRARRVSQVAGVILLGTVAAFLYAVLPLSPSPQALFQEEFGEAPDATITDLHGVRTGSAGNYTAHLQFHAPPETIWRFFGNGVQHPYESGYIYSGERPAFWLSPKTQGFQTEFVSPVSLPHRGHFGVRFHPDVRVVNYFPRENLVQITWTFYD